MFPFIRILALFTAVILPLASCGDIEDTEEYQEGYSVGKQTGYEEGFEEGRSEGYDEGHEEGFEEGKSEGDEEGYSRGKDEICDEVRIYTDYRLELPGC